MSDMPHCRDCGQVEYACVCEDRPTHRRIEHDGVVVLLPLDRKDRENAHTLLWLAGHVNKGV